MGKPSREKGKRGERDVVRRFIAKGVPCRRRWEEQSKEGGQSLGDFAIGEPAWPIYAEGRHRENLAIPAWLREIEEQAPPGFRHVLFFRRNNKDPDWQAVIPLDDYIDLLRRAYADGY